MVERRNSRKNEKIIGGSNCNCIFAWMPRCVQNLLVKINVIVAKIISWWFARQPAFGGS